MDSTYQRIFIFYQTINTFIKIKWFLRRKRDFHFQRALWRNYCFWVSKRKRKNSFWFCSKLGKCQYIYYHSFETWNIAGSAALFSTTIVFVIEVPKATLPKLTELVDKDIAGPKYDSVFAINFWNTCCSSKTSYSYSIATRSRNFMNLRWINSWTIWRKYNLEKISGRRIGVRSYLNVCGGIW